MAERVDAMAGPEVEQVKIMLNTLYLCIGYAVRHVAKHEGEGAAVDLKRNMLETLKAGDIDMALDRRPMFPPAYWRIRRLICAVMRRAFPSPFSWQIRWA